METERHTENKKEIHKYRNKENRERYKERKRQRKKETETKWQTNRQPDKDTFFIADVDELGLVVSGESAVWVVALQKVRLCVLHLAPRAHANTQIFYITEKYKQNLLSLIGYQCKDMVFVLNLLAWSSDNNISSMYHF